VTHTRRVKQLAIKFRLQFPAGREYYLLWLGDTRYPAGEFFDHFHNDHEPDIRAWLVQNPPH
jgi:hypothetical protein